MGKEPRYIGSEEVERLGIDKGSKRVKELASKQKLRVTLSEEQMEAIRSQWGDLDNGRPAEITFEVEGREAANLKVAAYGYFSDTCCA